MAPIKSRFNRPDRPYYGWVIVGVITITGLAACIQFNPTLSVFIIPITQQFDWSISAFAGAITIGTLLGGLLSIAIGPLLDRFGGRWILFSGIFLMGGLVFSLGLVDQLWHFYAVIIMSRMVLQGVIQIANQVVVAKWFRRMRGRASAIANIGQRVGNGTMPLLAQAVLNSHGWRVSAMTLGILAWALALLPVSIWLRRHPQDMGLETDGIAISTTTSTGSHHYPPPTDTQSPKSLNLREALRTRVFYILLAGFAFNHFIHTGIAFNLLPLLVDRGFTSSQAAGIVGAWSLLGIPATIATGLLRDKIPLKYLLAGIFAGTTLGLLLLTQVNNLWMGLVFAAVHGTFFAGILLLDNLAYADYFGPESLGAIRGFSTPFQMASNSFGPLAAALVFDITDSYMPILIVYIGIFAALSLTMTLASPPKTHSITNSN